MTEAQALAALKAKAYIRCRSSNGHQHWSHGRIIGVNRSGVVAMIGGRDYQDHFDNFELDNKANHRFGIHVDSPEASVPANNSTSQLVILHTEDQDWLGYTGRSVQWSARKDEWMRFADFEQANEVLKRLKKNGVKCVDAIAFSKASERFDQHEDAVLNELTRQESPGTAPVSVTPGLLEQIIGVGSSNLSAFKVARECMQKMERILQDQSNADRDEGNDRENIGRMQSEVDTRLGLIERAKLKLPKYGDDRARREAELAGVRAEFSSILKQ